MHPMPFDLPADCPAFQRCTACGSDSSPLTYEQVADIYGPHFEVSEVEASGGHQVRVDEICSNLDWFGHHADEKLGKDFLDVGCCDGAGLRGMQDRGWRVHGFDVFEPSYMGPHVTVAPFFHRWLFPRRYAAVLCREVWEHVQCPDLFLHELHGVTVPGGLVQLQTPKAIDHFHAIPYQRGHLQIASPAQLRRMLHGAMLDVIDAREWDLGQAYLCRARR